MATFLELQKRLTFCQKKEAVYEDLINHIFKYLKGGEILVTGDHVPVDREVFEEILEEIDSKLKPISAEIKKINETEVDEDDEPAEREQKAPPGGPVSKPEGKPIRKGLGRRKGIRRKVPRDDSGSDSDRQESE